LHGRSPSSRRFGPLTATGVATLRGKYMGVNHGSL
jgi:hypothetical protein